MLRCFSYSILFCCSSAGSVLTVHFRVLRLSLCCKGMFFVWLPTKLVPPLHSTATREVSHALLSDSRDSSSVHQARPRQRAHLYFDVAQGFEHGFRNRCVVNSLPAKFGVTARKENEPWRHTEFSPEPATRSHERANSCSRRHFPPGEPAAGRTSQPSFAATEPLTRSLLRSSCTDSTVTSPAGFSS